MKDWRRSPEPPGMMGVKDATYAVQGNWGQPEELSTNDFDPASPLPHTTPTLFVTDSRTRHPQAHTTSTQSLYSMCLRVILRNIASVQDLGVLPYRHAKPILEECRIDQLIALEEASPHLLEHSDEIWKRNCLRDFLDLRRKYSSPAEGVKEPKSWRRLYFRTKGETEQAKTDAAKRIKDKYEQHRAEKEAKKLVVRDRPMLAKAARAGGRKFGVAVGGVSKGQSLLNKARLGSAAQAKLTAPRNTGFRTQGRSKAVGAEIAPEAAGVGVTQKVRPMVAPRAVLGRSSEGLAKMKEFSRPLSGSEGAATQPSSARKIVQRQDSDGMTPARQAADVESLAVPRLKPHEVAAAPALSSASRDRARTTTLTADKPARRDPASPAPDVARTERRKLDFFGGAAVRSSPSSSSNPVATSSSSSSSPRGASSPLSPGVEVRGMKRAPSYSLTADTLSAKASGSKAVQSPPAKSASPFFPSRTAAGESGGIGGVRVVQAKRARMQERSIDASSSPYNSPPPAVATPSNGRDKEESEKRPVSTPVRWQSSTASISRPSPVKDTRMARASPAALSSIFMPSSSSSSPAAAYRNGASNSSGRNGSGGS
ncbi:hypothetical protein EX895_001673 [Sporisorium graminicola]|uniref:Elongin-A n=1 Tax=Sporisorium graminicola TaxID=280036 RepID=A0A4U7L1M0_9BASI|nr:hypothetical protein EX895_001673 [Sporisorium graminicola]TKY89142.1 hypothetical protein EX895_001673 [Sporisorium graminicola]